MAAAIDFGTTYSGYAFTARHEFQRDPTKARLKSWEDPTSSMMHNKTSTCILFNKEKEFSKLGFEVEAKYLNLILDNDHENWHFFKIQNVALRIKGNSHRYDIKNISHNIYQTNDILFILR